MLLLAVLSAVMFLSFLGRREFATSHEARVAQVARVMADSGWPWDATPVEVPRARLVKRGNVIRLAADPDAPPTPVNPWLVPVLDEQLRLQKPPLPYWCAAIAFRMAGGATEAMARLVPAILGALTVFLLYDLTHLLYGTAVAWCTSLVWLTTYLVPEEYRLAMADPYLAFFTLSAVWAWTRSSMGLSPRTRGSLFNGHKIAPDPIFRPSVSRAPFLNEGSRYVLLFYLAVGLGALAKGPVVLLTVAVPLLAFHACFRRRAPGGIVAHLAGIALLVLVALPWPLAVLRHVPNAVELWRYESVGELSDNTENARAWWYYFANLPLLTAPWTPMWVFALVYAFLRNRPRTSFPITWFLVLFLCFSVVHLKKNPYLLPAMPAQAMMIGLAATTLLRVARRIHFRGIPGALIITQSAIGIGFAVVLALLLWRQHRVPAVMLGLMILMGLATCIPLWPILRRRPMPWLVAQTLAYCMVLLVFCNFYVTPENNARSPKAVCEELKPMIDGMHRAALVSKLPEEVAFYLPLRARGAAPRQWLWVKDDEKDAKARAKAHKPPPDPIPEEFEGWVPGAKVVSVRRVPVRSAPGDARWKVYELTVDYSRFAEAVVP